MLSEDNKEINKWISVKDSLPKEHLDVIVVYSKFGKRFQSIYIGFIENGKWCIVTDDGVLVDCDNSPDHYEVTHWMHLPDLPKVNP